MKITFALMAIVVGLVLVNPFGADTIHQKGQVQADGITIAYESFGKPDRETILLMGVTRTQLADWPTEFCEELVSRSYMVVICDNRDIGLSSKFDGAGVPDLAAVIQAAVVGKPAPQPYTLYDMANDAVSLLDALGDVGSGTMNIFCYVVDAKIAESVIVRELRRVVFSKVPRFAERIGDTVKVLWPRKFKSAFSLV